MAQLITMGGLIDRTWDHYRAHFNELMHISGWIILLGLFDLVALFFYPKSSTLELGSLMNGAETFGIVLFAIVNIIIAPLFGLWLFIALVRLVRGQLESKHAPIREALRDGVRLYLPCLLVNILALLMIVLAGAIGIVPGLIFGWIAGAIGNQALVVLAALVMIAGGITAVVLAIRWSVFYALSPFALLMDHLHGRAALTQSRTLAQKNFWHTLLLLIVPKLVFLLIGFIILFIVSYAVQLALTVFAGLSIDTYVRLISMSDAVFPILLAVLLNPLLVISDSLLYRSLKEASA